MKERVLEKLKLAEVAVRKVRDNTPKSLEAFSKAGIVKDGILKNLEEAAQNILDSCALIVRELDLGIPGDEGGFLEILAKERIIDGQTLGILQSFRGLRNRLVHAYGTIDDEIVYENIRGRLGQLQKAIDALRSAAAERLR